MKAALFYLSALAFFITSIMLRPDYADASISIPEFNAQELFCNYLMLLSLLTLCAYILFFGRAISHKKLHTLGDHETNIEDHIKNF